VAMLDSEVIPLAFAGIQAGNQSQGHRSLAGGWVPVPNAAAYVASKWGLNGLSVSVAEELRNYGIRVSIICPGSTDTELRRAGHGDPGKMLQPHDVAHVVGMLVTQSEQSFASEITLRPTRKP